MLKQLVWQSRQNKVSSDGDGVAVFYFIFLDSLIFVGSDTLDPSKLSTNSRSNTVFVLHP